MDDAAMDFTMDELREFLEARPPRGVRADPAFKERLRRKLWAIVRFRGDHRVGGDEEHLDPRAPSVPSQEPLARACSPLYALAIAAFAARAADPDELLAWVPCSWRSARRCACWGAGHLVKNDLLSVAGPYAHLRHPLYAGTLCLALGFGVIAGGWALVLVLGGFLPVFFLYYFPYKERIESARLELRHGRAYAEYRRAVPALLPSLVRFTPTQAARRGPRALELRAAARERRAWDAARDRRRAACCSRCGRCCRRERRAPRSGLTRANLAERTLVCLERGGRLSPDVWLVESDAGRVVVKDFAARGRCVRATLGPLVRAPRVPHLPPPRAPIRRCRGCSAASMRWPSRWSTAAACASRAADPGPSRPSSAAGSRRAVRELHALGVVHLDLRHRSNVRAGLDGAPVLIDFASAVSFRPGGLAARSLLPLLGLADRWAVRKWRRRLADYPAAPGAPPAQPPRARAEPAGPRSSGRSRA